MQERFNWQSWKDCVPLPVPWVRIPPLPPIFRIRILGECCLAPPEAGLGFGKDFEGIFEIQKQFLPAQTKVRFAEGKHKFEKFINQSFLENPDPVRDFLAKR